MLTFLPCQSVPVKDPTLPKGSLHGIRFPDAANQTALLQSITDDHIVLINWFARVGDDIESVELDTNFLASAIGLSGSKR